MTGRKRWTEARIIQILEEVEAGASISDVCRRHGLLHIQYYKWRVQYGGMQSDELRRLHELETENTRLKILLAEEQLLIDVLLDRTAELQVSTRGRIKNAIENSS